MKARLKAAPRSRARSAVRHEHGPRRHAAPHSASIRWRCHHAMTKAAAIGGSPVAIGSRLRRALDAGRSVITAELAVPATVAHKAARLVRKHAAGAVFVQTQPMFDAHGFAAAIDRLPVSLTELPIIIGLAPIRSCDHAQRLGAIPGIVIPDRLLALLDRASDEADACERYWAYLDAELDWLTRNVPHRGFHLMPIGHSKRGIRQSSSFDRLYAAVTRALEAAAPKPADVAARV